MSSFNYIAILGRQPELGLVELESLLGAGKVRPFGQSAALLAEAPDLDRLGGVVKLGRVICELWPDDLSRTLHDRTVWDAVLGMLTEFTGKVPFGVSVYGRRINSQVV